MKMSLKNEEPSKAVKTNETRLRTVAQMLDMPDYAWATNSYLRHAIFEAEERIGSGGATAPGNGLAPAIVRIGRKVLIDLDEFDRWIEGHRMVRLIQDTPQSKTSDQEKGGMSA